MSIDTSTVAGWRSTVDTLRARDALTTVELEQLSRAHWMLGDVPACLGTDELLVDRHLADGDATAAAGCALRIALRWATRGDFTLAMAWASRAERMLEDEPRGVVHGYALYFRASADLELGEDTDAAHAAAVELAALAAEHPDKSLACFASTLAGMVAVRRGDLRGFARLDEAMIPVVAGHVDPVWGGDIYCSVIHLCEALGDLARMRSWTDALARWAAPLSATFMFAGVTRVHQLQLLRAEGAWDVVEAELAERSAGLVDAHGWVAGAGFYELGEVRRLRGDARGAQECYDRARGLGVEPQPGEALLQHAAGRTDEAVAGLRIALTEPGRLARARVLEAAVEIGLAAGETRWAEDLAAELEDTAAFYGTPGLVAAAARARAALLLAARAAADAVPLLERAVAIHRAQRHQHAVAQVHEALATAYRQLGRADRAAASEATARAIHTRLGAHAELARLAPATAPGGLTAREVEVLREVSSGRTNREVGAALVISEKTVSRHLASIFTKLGVSSRTAAAAWAREHHLA